jgi:transcriptional regulator with XRE-family HTH domain
MFPMDDSDQDIALRLIALRKRLGYAKQSDFAKEIGLEKSSYNPFETGDRPLTLNAARRIRRRFGISADWLLFGDLGQPSQNIAIELGPTPGASKAPRKPSKRGSA